MELNGEEVSFSMAKAEDWQEYERRKRAWIAEHGWTTEAEYHAAINKICEELGL